MSERTYAWVPADELDLLRARVSELEALLAELAEALDKLARLIPHHDEACRGIVSDALRKWRIGFAKLKARKPMTDPNKPDLSIIERVEQAIGEKFAPAVDMRAPYAKVMLKMAACAAIEAMREPTKERIKKAPPKQGL